MGRQRGPWELLMASITNLICGTDREYFDLSERAGASVERAGDLLDEVLAGFPHAWGLTQNTTPPVAIATEESRELAIRPTVATGSTDTDDVCGPVWRQA
jgi:hypothetical protein